MPNERAQLIEAYLLAARGWVSAVELCTAFNVSKRDLRARDGRPGLCSEYAISGNRGFRHVAHCTKDEFERSCHRITEHAEAELRRVTQQRLKRASALATAPRAVVFERDSDQALLLTPP